MIDYFDLATKAELLRKRFNEDNNSPIDIFTFSQEIENLTLIFYPMESNLSGMCIKNKHNNCIIAINSSMTLGRQRFSLAHELYHMFYDSSMINVCSKKIYFEKGNESERKADIFASFFLMPRVALIEKVEKLLGNEKMNLSLEDIIKIEQHFGVSHQTALYQLYNCSCISKKELEAYLNKSVIKIAARNGFNIELYNPTNESKQYFTYGQYINLTNKALAHNLISNGKYEELLIEAFRADIVYGMDEGSGNIID